MPGLSGLSGKSGLSAIYGGFDPAQAGTFIARLQPDKLGLNNNDAVGVYTDLSGNSNDFSQATSANKPTFKTNIQNGLPCIQFNGTNSWLNCPTNFYNAQASTGTFFVACQTSVSSIQCVATTRGNADGWELRYNSTTQAEYDHIGGWWTGTFTIPTGFIVLMFRRNGTTVELGVNGTFNAPSTQAAGYTPASHGTYLGVEEHDGGFAPGRRFFNGNMGDVLAYSNVLSDSNVANVWNWLKARWGL